MKKYHLALVFSLVLAACPSDEPRTTNDTIPDASTEHDAIPGEVEGHDVAQPQDDVADDDGSDGASDGVTAADTTPMPVDASSDGSDGNDTPDVATGPADEIYGTAVPRADSWWVEDGRIHHGNQIRRLRGINWFGLETSDRALHGTWSGRKVEDFLREIRQSGFDALRIPVSPQTITPGFEAASWAVNAYAAGEARTGFAQLTRLLEVSGDFAVLLDFHTCDPTKIGPSLPGRPDGCDGYDADAWVGDLVSLAAIARAYPHVVGIDLANEPHALTWSAWRALAERAGEVILRVNPRLLIFVEGVAGASPFGTHYPFWGENLTEAADDPPNLPRSRLVFSPHVYGPSVANQSYFSASNYPSNLAAIWQTHFGHVVPEFGFAIGEFGGRYDDAHGAGEVAWNETFVAWLATVDRGQPASFFYWCVNANSGDTGGLYLDDWTTIDSRRLTLLAPLLAE